MVRLSSVQSIPLRRLMLLARTLASSTRAPDTMAYRDKPRKSLKNSYIHYLPLRPRFAVVPKPQIANHYSCCLLTDPGNTLA